MLRQTGLNMLGTCRYRCICLQVFLQVSLSMETSVVNKDYYFKVIKSCSKHWKRLLIQVKILLGV